MSPILNPLFTLPEGGIIRPIVEDQAILEKIQSTVARTYYGQQTEGMRSTDFPQYPHVMQLMYDHPALFHEVDKILHKWQMRPEFISYLDCGQEALVFKLYSVPFVLKLLHHNYIDQVTSSHFVIHPLHRESVVVMPDRRLDKFDRIPEVKIVIERELEPYGSISETAPLTPGMYKPPLRPDQLTNIQESLLMDCLLFRDFKHLNLMFFRPSAELGFSDLDRAHEPSNYPIVTDFGALDVISQDKAPYRTVEHAKRAKEYANLQRKFCPIRGPLAVQQVITMIHMNFDMGQRLYDSYRAQGMSHEEICHFDTSLSDTAGYHRKRLEDPNLFRS